MQHSNHSEHSEHGMARSLLRSTCIGWFERCRELRFTSPRVPGQGSSPAYFRLEAASSLKRRSQGLSCVIGNFHAQFLEGWTGAIPSGYSVMHSNNRRTHWHTSEIRVATHTISGCDRATTG